MGKIRIRKKNKHVRSLEDEIQNAVVVKNKKLQKNKEKKKGKNKKRETKDLQKIYKLAKEEEENYYDDDLHIEIEGENGKEVEDFLEFDDDMNEIDYNMDLSFNDSNINENEEDDSIDIFKEYNININNKIKDTNALYNNVEGCKEIDPEKEKEEKILAQVRNCYKIIGEHLAQYKKGKIHEAIKLLTKSPKWFELLMITEPKNWTMQATYEVTKIFSSGLKESQVEKYFEFILLPILLQNIEQKKKLDSFLYQSLIKSLYKSAAWFRGILFPLIRKTCTKRELIIVGSVIQKMSIHINYAMQALVEMFALEWNSTLGYFVNIMFNKKYAFPKSFISRCVEYFLQFEKEQNQNPLPLIWHKSLLSLVQNYNEEFTDHQREEIKRLVQKQNHHMVSKAIIKHISPTSLMHTSMENIDSHV